MENRPSLTIKPPREHEAHNGSDEHPNLTARNARSAWWLFLVYVILYGGFVGISAFNPALMGRRVIAGVNLAVVYGMVLIVAAILLALVYMVLCKNAAASHASEQKKIKRPPTSIADRPDDSSEGGQA